MILRSTDGYFVASSALGTRDQGHVLEACVSACAIGRAGFGTALTAAKLWCRPHPMSNPPYPLRSDLTTNLAAQIDAAAASLCERELL